MCYSDSSKIFLGNKMKNKVKGKNGNRKTVTLTVRLEPQQKEKVLKVLGGGKWIRQKIDEESA